MKHPTGHVAIIGGLVAVAMVSVGGAVAWSRADAAQRLQTTANPSLVEGRSARANPRSLRDLAAIKRLQVPLASLTRDPFHQASFSAKPALESTRPQLLAAVQALRLESILCTETLRSCTISGKTLSEGESTRSFVVEKINSASVTLKNGLYRFELRVQR